MAVKDTHLQPIVESGTENPLVRQQQKITFDILKDLYERQLIYSDQVEDLRRRLYTQDAEEQTRYSDVEDSMQKTTQTYDEQERIIEIADYVSEEQEIIKLLEDFETEQERENMLIYLSNIIDRRMEKIFSRAQYLRSNMEKRQYDYYCSYKFAKMIKTYAGSYTHFGARAADFFSAVFQTFLMLVVRAILILRVLSAYFDNYSGCRTALFCVIMITVSVNMYLQRQLWDLTFLGKIFRLFQRIIMRLDLLIMPAIMRLLQWPLGVSLAAAELLVGMGESGLRLISRRFAATQIVSKVLSVAHWLQNNTLGRIVGPDSALFRCASALWSMIDYVLCPFCSTWEGSVVKSSLCVYAADGRGKNCANWFDIINTALHDVMAWLARGLIMLGWTVLPWNWWQFFDHVEDGLVKFKRNVLDAYAND